MTSMIKGQWPPAPTWQDSRTNAPTTPSRVPKVGATLKQHGTTYVFKGIGKGGWVAQVRSGTLSPLDGGWPNAGAKGTKVMAIQKALAQEGFPVHADGIMGPATVSALQYYHTHKSNQGWKPPANAKVVTQHPNGSVTRGGSVGGSDNTGGGGSVSRTTSATKPTKIPGLGDPNIGSLINEDLATSGAQPYSADYADKMAGLQFDPQIHETKVLQTRAPLDAAQHQKDIGSWYNQVQASLKTAKDRNATAATNATSTIGNTSRDILSSIGGEANQGSQTVAAQGMADAAMQAQLGQNEQSYQNDLAPLLQNEAAGQKVGQANKDTLTAQDLANKLMELQGQRGQAKSTAAFQVQGLNNDILNQQLQTRLGIKNSNNSILQQRYQNALSAQTAAIAAAMSNAQIGYYNAASKSTASAGGGFTPWAKLNAAQKQQIVDAAAQKASDATGALLPNSSDIVKNYMMGQGFNSYGTNTPAGTQMGSLLNAALAHAQGLLKQRQAAAAAAGTTYNGG